MMKSIDGWKDWYHSQGKGAKDELDKGVYDSLKDETSDDEVFRGDTSLTLWFWCGASVAHILDNALKEEFEKLNIKRYERKKD